jgi:hypothetical protein
LRQDFKSEKVKKQKSEKEKSIEKFLLNDKSKNLTRDKQSFLPFHFSTFPLFKEKRQ